MEKRLVDADVVRCFWQYYFHRHPNAERGLNIILHEYSSPSRHYHGLSHLAHGISQFDDILELRLEEEDSLAFAWACHDLRYSAKVPDSSNVKSSAKRALIIAKAMKFPYHQERMIAKAVLATSHKLPPESLVEKAIVDLDLSIFGANERTYQNYERGIRKEYGHVLFEDYQKARTDIMARFLKKDRLHWLDSFHKKYDSVRKKNIEWSIRVLEQGRDFLNEQ